MSKAFVITALLATAQARFGQEGSVQSIISALGNFGNPGEAPTLAGATPGVLLAGANACDKLTLADKIVATLGNDPQVIAAAAQLVAAEKNFNPFVVSVPAICSDVNLPATPELRGIVPLVDPAVTGSDTENANSKTSLTKPFSADGLSVADIMKANGFSNFTTQASSGATGGNASGNAGNNGNAGNAAASTTAAAAATTSCAGVSTVTVTAGAGDAAATTTAAAAATSAAASDNNNAGNTGGVQQSTIAGLDFGLCVPTIKFEPGLNGRKDTEFTFQAIDPLVNKGQQEALNPNIITNRVCDQLTNVCKANQAAKDACQAAKAKIQALGTKNADTANTWNTELGFAGTNINPDNAPQPGLVGHS